MPTLRITTADEREMIVEDSATLEAEIGRFERAFDALIPDLDGNDDEAGMQAVGRYRILAYHCNAILAQIDWWNDQVAKERRAARRDLAAVLKARRGKK